MTAAATLLAVCETRLGKPDDLAWVVDCWTKNDPELRTMRLSLATRHVRALLRVPSDVPLHTLPAQLPQLIVAHVPGEPDALLGWAAIERASSKGPPCLHYLYVRSSARRLGVASALIGDVDVRIEYSHAAPRGVAVPGGWTLNLKRGIT